WILNQALPTLRSADEGGFSLRKIVELRGTAQDNLQPSVWHHPKRLVTAVVNHAQCLLISSGEQLPLDLRARRAAADLAIIHVDNKAAGLCFGCHFFLLVESAACWR